MRHATEQTVQDHDDQAEAEEGQHGDAKHPCTKGCFGSCKSSFMMRVQGGCFEPIVK